MPKLTDKEKIKRINEHIKKLEAGETVSKRDMKALLTEEQLAEFDNLWEMEKGKKDWVLDNRHLIKDYEEMLHTGDKIWARYENTRAANKNAEIENAAMSAYEKAWERLEELIEADPFITTLLDRPFDRDNAVGNGLSACEVPRCKYSKSKFVKPLEKTTKNELKADFLKAAVEELSGLSKENDIHEGSITSNRTKKLKALVKRIDDS